MTRPVLWSFRRCPYAIRARLAILESAQSVELREVVLRQKPEAFLEASPKGTVPVLVLPDGQVIEESLEIMDWALAVRDPNQIAADPAGRALIADCEADFKPHLDRYKYHTRYDDAQREDERAKASEFVWRLDGLLGEGYLAGNTAGQTDLAIAPFVRQFANTDRTWFDAQKWSFVGKWLTAFETSDRFAAIMAKYPQWEPGTAGVAFP
ncbi:MAG: glutathione S-transferase [Pseudomonadota bacterium]